MGKNKGKIGEARTARILTKISEVEETVDFTKPSFTNAPDNGVDFELKAPHNIAEKLDGIIEENPKIANLSNHNIHIRIDNKDYNGKISKPVVDKFLKDIDKNPEYAEHWLAGGSELTKGAKETFEKSNSVIRYYSKSNMNKIDNYYQNEIDNESYNEHSVDD